MNTELQLIVCKQMGKECRQSGCLHCVEDVCVWTLWNVISPVILSFVITVKSYTKFSYDILIIVCEVHGWLHKRMTFILGLYNLLLIKHKLNYILRTANTREPLWEKFPGCEQPLCCTLHTAAVDMPGYGAWLAEKLQIASLSAVSTYLLPCLPHGVITVTNNLPLYVCYTTFERKFFNNRT